MAAQGLSPRVRGNLHWTFDGLGIWGSIPARAGEPYPQIRQRKHPTVYPRACGGTRYSLADLESGHGLSPRVRGNPKGNMGRRSRYGSIPARAGEPRNSRSAISASTVYPRACGGTNLINRASSIDEGLSPRVRGNPLMRARGAWSRGSIPARAGEPWASAPIMICAGVYPRACGGTCSVWYTTPLTRGLSPRVRGNPRHVSCG